MTCSAVSGASLQKPYPSSSDVTLGVKSGVVTDYYTDVSDISVSARVRQRVRLRDRALLSILIGGSERSENIRYKEMVS